MKKVVAIIGGGFSGLAVALQLLRQRDFECSKVVIIEPRSQIGTGLAYSAPSKRFKLNVPAVAMGAFPEAPEDFLHWLRSHPESEISAQFAPRNLYGNYLNDLFTRYAGSRPDVKVEVITKEASDISFDQSHAIFTIILANGEGVQADACVLAVGNLKRSSLNEIDTGDLFRDPYETSSYTDLVDKREVALIGSGLTAVDVVIEAEARGFSGVYTLLSRHARLPLPHEPTDYQPPCAIDPLLSESEALQRHSLRTLVRWIASESRQVGSSQPAISAIRPHTQTIWSHLSPADKKSFLRHLRPIWEAHRHRIPQDSAELIESLKQQGRLTLSRARDLKARSLESGIELRYTSGEKPIERTFDAVFMCAGPEGDLRKIKMPLIQKLLERKIIQPGPLGLGVDLSNSALPLQAQERFKIIGPLQREALWEITAVRELRLEAAKVAQSISVALSGNIR